TRPTPTSTLLPYPTPFRSRSAAADQRDQLAAADGEVDPLVDLPPAEPCLDPDQLDDRLGLRHGRPHAGRFDRAAHRPTSWRITAMTASSRITATMLWTTVEVVLIPIERVSRLTDKPIEQPITPITSAKS